MSARETARGEDPERCASSGIKGREEQGLCAGAGATSGGEARLGHYRDRNGTSTRPCALILQLRQDSSHF